MRPDRSQSESFQDPDHIYEWPNPIRPRRFGLQYLLDNRPRKLLRGHGLYSMLVVRRTGIEGIRNGQIARIFG